MVQVEKLLDDCPPDRRSWEWHYLKRLCHADLLTLRGHTDAVNGVAYSPDGTRLASASSDGTVRVWDAITGQELLTPSPATRTTSDAVAFSPDGRRLASAGDDRTVQVWDVDDRAAESARFMGHTGPVRSVAFSPDGTRLVSAGWDRTVRVWDADDRQEVAFSPLTGHGDWIAAWRTAPMGDGSPRPAMTRIVRVWDATTGTSSLDLDGHTDQRCSAVAFSPDGTPARLGQPGRDS